MTRPGGDPPAPARVLHTLPVIAVLGGTLAAVCWAVATLAASRAARAVGARVVLGWVMAIGLALAIPITLIGGVPSLDATAWILLVVSGLGNVLGLLLAYTAFATGKISIAAPIVSTGGALAAVVAVVLGEAIDPRVGIALGAIAVGVVLAARESEGPATAGPADHYVPVATLEPAIVPEPAPAVGDGRRAVLFAVAAALSFSVALYATGRVGAELGVGLTVLPSRLAGVLLIAIPLATTGRLRLTTSIAPLVVLIGCLEVVGVIGIAIGSSDAISVTAVVSSQFAGVAALLAFVLYRERLARHQLLGIVLIAAGVAAVALLRA